MQSPVVTCDLGDIAHITAELARDLNNFGVGVLNLQTGEIRLFTYDETDTFSKANLHLQVMAGHEAASAMAGFSLADTRGFVVGLQAKVWHLFNQSHLNRADAEPNTMRMSQKTMDAVSQAISNAGVSSVITN